MILMFIFSTAGMIWDSSYGASSSIIDNKWGMRKPISHDDYFYGYGYYYDSSLPVFYVLITTIVLLVSIPLVLAKLTALQEQHERERIIHNQSIPPSCVRVPAMDAAQIQSKNIRQVEILDYAGRLSTDASLLSRVKYNNIKS